MDEIKILVPIEHSERKDMMKTALKPKKEEKISQDSDATPTPPQDSDATPTPPQDSDAMDS